MAMAPVYNTLAGWSQQNTEIGWLGVGHACTAGHAIWDWCVATGEAAQNIPDATVNFSYSCFEVILLAALQSGQTPGREGAKQKWFRKRLEQYYKIATKTSKAPENAWQRVLQGGNRLRTYTGSTQPQLGQLVYFAGDGHVCVATGEMRHVGGNVRWPLSPGLLSFWGPFPRFQHPTGGIPTRVMLTTVAEVKAYMAEAACAGLRADTRRRPQDYVVEFGNPVWA